MVFSLSAHCWKWIRGLWKLPDGRDWLRGKLGLVLMGGAMLSKSLTQLSVDRWSCVPSLLFTWGQTIWPPHLKRPWWCEGLGAGGEGDDRGLDGWMASPTQWTWVWVNFGSWWWTGRSGVLWFMGSQKVGHDWVTELNWNYGGGDEDNGDILQKVPCTHCYIQCPQPCSRPLATHASAGDSWTLLGKSGSVSCGVTAPFFWILVHTRFSLCPSRVYFPCAV